MKTSSIFILGAVIIGFIVFSNNDSWIGFYYPDANNLDKWVQSDKLDSLDECRDWVDGMVLARYQDTNSDYECGQNCKYDSLLEINVCEETLQ